MPAWLAQEQLYRYQNAVKTDLDTGMYQVQDRLYHRKYILYFHGKYIKKSQRLAVRATTDLFLVTVLLCKRDQYIVLLYT
jgi:hypothetical protein